MLCVIKGLKSLELFVSASYEVMGVQRNWLHNHVCMPQSVQTLIAVKKVQLKSCINAHNLVVFVSAIKSILG